MTATFIYIAFGIIVLYDILVVVLKKQTISSVFRKWFREKPLVPFMIGAVFIGHFGVYQWNHLLIPAASLWVFIGLSAVFLVWYIIENIKKNKSKFYDVMCRLFPIPMTIGILVGSFWV